MQGAQASKYGPKVSHFFFPDDSLFFAKAEKRESQKVKDMLMNYETCLGLVINFEKSSILFSGNINGRTQTKIKELFRVQETINLEKYLGLPTMVGRNRKKSFRDIKNKMEARLSGCSKRSFICRWQGNVLEGNCPSYSYLCHELFPFPKVLLS